MTPLTRNAREGGEAGVFPEKHRTGKIPLEESVLLWVPAIPGPAIYTRRASLFC